MLLRSLGGIGLGFVWGWLLGLVGRGARRPIFTGSFLMAAVLLQAVAVIALAGWAVTAPFALSCGFAYVMHMLWRRQLSVRYQARPTSKEDL